MSYIFEKQHIEKFEVTTVGFNFLKYSVVEYARSRVSMSKKDKCEFCGHKFESDEWTHLAMVKGKVNHLICGKCANTSVEGGASKVKMKEEAKE